MSLNLHDIVRHAITANKADDVFDLFRSAGQEMKDGIMTAVYAAPIRITGQFQSENDAALAHADMAGQNSIIRKLYVYAPDDLKTRPWSIYRPLARSGDYVRDRFGGYWLVTAVTEDFSECGWECLRVTFQQTTKSLPVSTGVEHGCCC